MQRARHGDEDAYAELLVLLADATRAYIRARVGPLPPWTDDAMQETLVAVHRARHTFDAGRPFAPWFYAIARNRFVDVLRRESRVRRHELHGYPASAVTGSTVGLEGRVDMDAVRRALASLPPRQREIVEALKLRDETVRDIAGRLDMTVAAVKVTAHRGYRTLRRLLGMDVRVRRPRRMARE